METSAVINDDEVPVSLFEQLDVDKEDERPPVLLTDKDMDREAFLQLVKEHGPKPHDPYPNYVLMDHKTGLLYAEPDAEVIRLDHCKFVPLPYHVITNDQQDEHFKIAIEEFGKLSQNPLFASFVIPTPALLIRLSSRPGLRHLENIKQAKQEVIRKFQFLTNSPLEQGETEEDRDQERRHILQNYIHLEFQATDFPFERERYEDKGWSRYITTGEAITQYMRAKKMIEMTDGFSQFDAELRRVMRVYIHKANGRLTEGIKALGRSINRYITEDVDGLVTQTLRHGDIYDLSGVNPALIEAACIMYTTGMIRLLERWILFVAGVAGEEFMDYHCIGNYTESQFLQDVTIQSRCARENVDAFVKRRGEENERWRSLPENLPNILKSFTQWPDMPSEKNIQLPPNMFTKEMCGVLACHMAYARLEDRNSFGLSIRITERARLYLGMKVKLPQGDFDQRQQFWIAGQDEPLRLWSTIPTATPPSSPAHSDDEEEGGMADDENN